MALDTPAARTLEAPFLGARLRHALQAYTAELAEALPDLTDSQYMVLDALTRHAPCSQTAIVAVTGIDRSTLADIVGRLERKGLVARKRTKEDQRSYAVKLTEAGTNAWREAKKVVGKVDRALETKLTRAVFQQPG